MQQVNITTERAAGACAAAAKLLTNDERVNVPPSMAMDGTLALAVGILTSLANGTAVLSNPPEAGAQVVELPKGGEGGEPAKTPVAEAVGEAVKEG